MWDTAQVPARAGEPPMTAAGLRHALEGLRTLIIRDGDALYGQWEPTIARDAFAASARNLANYLTLRRHDLRELQVELMSWGLSSLGRCESRVLETVDAVLFALARIEGIDEPPVRRPDYQHFFAGNQRLRAASAEVLGPEPGDRSVRIMVTLPTVAATDAELVRDLVARGMDVARINCAHDDAAVWQAMADNVRGAATGLHRTCRICADISGPRARTTHVHGEGQRVHVGDTLQLFVTGRGSDGQLGFECSLPDVVAQLRVGETVAIDGGRLRAVVTARGARGARLQVTRTPPKGLKLRADKGLNFPDTELELDALTAKDVRDLDDVVELADMVGYSFVQRRGDVLRLQSELRARGAPELAIVAKVETKQALRNLPELIVQVASRQPLAVMIARGDLAVELGPRRLAEIQEELLWLCEAAHVPVIWATEVLDSYVHSQLSARAEITDAAMAERAECVMLNKGPYLPEGVSLLADVLHRMEAHQYKKTSRMRALALW